MKILNKCTLTVLTAVLITGTLTYKTRAKWVGKLTVWQTLANNDAEPQWRTKYFEIHRRGVKQGPLQNLLGHPTTTSMRGTADLQLSHVQLSLNYI